MTDMVTVQELENAKVDARTIGESVNENKIVTPRYGVPFKSMPMIAEEMQGILGTVIAGGVPASIVLDESGKTQQELNSNLSFKYSYLNNAIYRELRYKLSDSVSVKDFGAIGDGFEHHLSEKFSTLAEAQAIYPFATSLSQQIDGCAIQAALNDSAVYGFVATVPSGDYMHDGLVYSNKSKLRGSGVGSSKLNCVNTSVADSLLVPNGGPSWLTDWELSGLTITSKVKTTGQAGFRLDTCRGGLISNIKVENMGIGWMEKGCWNLLWFRVQVTGCKKIATCESATYAGIPNYRYGTYCSGNEEGIEIPEKGLSCTTFVGGGIERCQSYALKIYGSENRTVKFIGFNFEDNNLETNGYDVIVGNNAITNSGVPNLSFDSCQFTCPSGSSKKAFNLLRGVSFSCKNSAFNGGYVAGADVSSNFGGFDIENLSGLSYWCESETSGFMLLVGRSLKGTKQSAIGISGQGVITTYQTGSTNDLLRSQRTTEAHPRFKIRANGQIDWHAFNSETQDVSVNRYNVKTIIVNGALQVGKLTTSGFPLTGQAGNGAICFDETTQQLKRVHSLVWRVIPVLVTVPIAETSVGARGEYALDANWRYDYVGDGTTHLWKKTALQNFI